MNSFATIELLLVTVASEDRVWFYLGSSSHSGEQEKTSVFVPDIGQMFLSQPPSLQVVDRNGKHGVVQQTNKKDTLLVKYIGNSRVTFV